MKQLVVMLGHKARTGKDTLAEFLCKDYGFVRFAFADKLKEVVRDLYGFSYQQMYGDAKDQMDERYPNYIDNDFLKMMIGQVKNPAYAPFLTPRRILQTFGQDQRRICPDIWANYVFDHISNPEDIFHDRVVITDMRFPNEHAVGLKWAAQNPDRKVIAVKITRPTAGIAFGSADISETALDYYDKWDIEINNDGSKEDLLNKFLMGVPGFDRMLEI